MNLKIFIENAELRKQLEPIEVIDVDLVPMFYNGELNNCVKKPLSLGILGKSPDWPLIMPPDLEKPSDWTLITPPDLRKSSDWPSPTLGDLGLFQSYQDVYWKIDYEEYAKELLTQLTDKHESYNNCTVAQLVILFIKGIRQLASEIRPDTPFIRFVHSKVGHTVWLQAIHHKKWLENFPTIKISLLFIA